MAVLSKQRFKYGSHPSHYVEAWIPAARSADSVAVVLHGGWWRARHNLHVMDDLCADLARAGWLAWNVEYRRIDGDGGWPRTFHDVLAAIDQLNRTWRASRISVIGHSAGGHLALLSGAARQVAGVVALAPITNLADCARNGLGEGAVGDFIGASPEAAPTAYASASPMRQLPLGSPQLILHGRNDQRVPVQHSRDYAVMAQDAGDAVTYVELSDADHFAVIDPADPSWHTVVTWLNGLAPRHGSRE